MELNVYPQGVRRVLPKLIDQAVFCVGRGISAPIVRAAMKDEKDPWVWTLNQCRDFVDIATMHWQIHKEETLDEKSDMLGPPLPPALPEMTRDVYPYDRIRHCFLGSTIDHMVAYADLLNVERVYLYGCDYVGITRSEEVSSLRYWIGIIRGKGGIVKLSDFSQIFKGEIYG